MSKISEKSLPSAHQDADAAIIGVDLGKTVFQLCVADSAWRVTGTLRLSRTQFERYFINRRVALVVMEACATSHHWARWMANLGIEVRLIPAQYVRAYVRRNKTDATDAAAICERPALCTHTKRTVVRIRHLSRLTASASDGAATKTRRQERQGQGPQ